MQFAAPDERDYKVYGRATLTDIPTLTVDLDMRK